MTDKQNEKLVKAITNYKVISAIAKKAKDLTLTDKNKYVSTFNLPIFGKKTKDHKLEIDNYFDNLSETILEYSCLELIACFEAIVIERIELASGEMKKNIKENYNYSLPFVSFQDKFVKNKDDIGSLNKILDLLEGKISEHLYGELDQIIKYRNYIAHGKRFQYNSESYSIEDIYNIIQKILEEIKKG